MHICLGVDQAVSHIPQLLRGMIPRQMREDPEQLGSMSYVSRIGAIVVGPGSGIIQSMHDVVKMREACLNDRGVPWLFADVTGIEVGVKDMRSLSIHTNIGNLWCFSQCISCLIIGDILKN